MTPIILPPQRDEKPFTRAQAQELRAFVERDLGEGAAPQDRAGARLWPWLLVLAAIAVAVWRLA